MNHRKIMQDKFYTMLLSFDVTFFIYLLFENWKNTWGVIGIMIMLFILALELFAVITIDD